MTARSEGGLEQAKKCDHKIMITDVAIDKVPYVEIPGLSEEICRLIQNEHKEILRIAQSKNDSNEVLSVYSLENKRKVMVLGSETSVNPSTNPEAVGLVHSSGRNGLMYLHNHPSTKNFSLADIDTFIRNGQIKLMSVVSNQGEVHILCKKSSYDYAKMRLFMMNLLDNYNGEIDKILIEFFKKCGKVGVDYVKG